MVRKEFIQGGFPVNRRAPIIGLTSDNELHIFYSHYDLHKLAQTKEISKCIGIWPGKKNTDCFILDPKVYSKYSPSVIHKDIDSAEEINVFFSGSDFDRIEYKPGPFAENRTTIISRDKKLYQYLNNIGVKFKRFFE